MLGLIHAFPGPSVHAQVKPVSGWTKVNNSSDACTSGVCTISGGISSGNNLFHKLEKLEAGAGGDIAKIEIDNNELTSIIISNNATSGSKIGVPFEALGSKADLILLSPYGIATSQDFSANNIHQLTLATADKLSIGSSLFDVNNTTIEQAVNMNGVVNYDTLSENIWRDDGEKEITLTSNLSVDSDLLLVADDFDISNGITLQTSQSLEINGRTRLNNTTIKANSLRLIGKGTVTEPQAILISDNSNFEITGNIYIEGTGKSESISDSFTNDSSGVGVNDSVIGSTSGNIKIKGIAGKGNYSNDKNETFGIDSDGPTGDFIDIGGIGVNITDNNSITANNGTIEIEGTGPEGAIIIRGSGIEIKSSKIKAQAITLDGIGAKGSEALNSTVGVRMQDNSEIYAVGNLTITGILANTEKNTTTHVDGAHGVLLGTSHLQSDSGMITLNGTGASGNKVKRAHGINILNEASIRGSRIKLTGSGGKATDLSSRDTANGLQGESYNNSGISINNKVSIDSNSGNDSGSTIIIGGSDENNGTIELVGTGGNGVFNVYGVGIDGGNNTFDSGGDLTITGVGGVENKSTESAKGVLIYGGSGVNTLLAKEKIQLTGTGGSGEKVNDGIGVNIDTAKITAKDLEIKGEGGRGDEFTTMTFGIGLSQSTINLDGTLDIYGKGGYAKTSGVDSIASLNGGVLMYGNTFNMPNSSSVRIDGESGDGGLSAIGMASVFNDWIVGGNTSIFGKGGKGNDVNLSAGIAIDSDSWSIQGHLILDGTGGQGVKTTANYGTKIAASSLVADSILIKGVGGSSTNTDESRANYGIGFLFSNIQTNSGNITVTGNGGTGGYDNTGVKILASNIKALNGIVDIDGNGGAGKIVQENNGVGLVNAEVDDLYDHTYFPGLTSISLYKNFDFSQFDTYIDSSNKTWYGNKIEAASIDIFGKGGVPTDKNQSKKNFGISMDDTKLISSGTMNITGQGGDGGQSIAGINVKDVILTAGGDTIVTGIAGVGDHVTNGEGIIFDSSTIAVTSASQIKLIGTGSGVDTETEVKTVNRLEQGEGIKIKDSTITSLTSSPTIEIIGTGGQSDDKINSQDNSGIKISNSTINSESGGGNQIYTGVGGIGGKLNTGIVLTNSTIKSNAGSLAFSGSGGGGVNIKESLGIASNTVELSGSKVSLNGVGGDSTLKKNAIDVNDLDTFNQTADNIGIEVKDSQISSLSGDLSITGNGGQLSVDGIVNPDKDDDIEAISVASSLEGVTLSNVTTTATASTLISGQAGKPIAGDNNRGTTIINSTIQTATVPAEVLDSATERNISAKSVDNRIEGNAYSGTNDNYGLSIDSTDIDSANQNLILAGRGGLKATGEKNYGIYIGNQSSVNVGKDGSSKFLNIYGAGGDGTDMTGGILTENTKYTVIGTINMYGESEGSGKFGNNSVEIFNGVNVSSSNDTSIGGNNNVNISEADIGSGNDTNITAQNDINLSETTIDSGNDSSLASGNDVNASESSINSGNNTNIIAENDINLTDSTVKSENDINLSALGDLEIAQSGLSSGNSINLQATNIMTGDVDLRSQELSIQSASFVSDNLKQSDSSLYNNSISLSAAPGRDGEADNYTDEQLTMSLSGNVNYFDEQSESKNRQSGSDSKKSDENGSKEDRKPLKSAQTDIAPTVLSSKQIRQKHMQSEEQSSKYVAEKLGLKRQPALSIQAIQQILSNGQRMMNSSI